MKFCKRALCNSTRGTNFDSLPCHGKVSPPVVPLTIESWNLDSPRNMGTNEVTWRVIISGASRTSEYIVCNVDCFRVCSSQDKDCINKGINWGKIKITKIELPYVDSLSFSSDLVRGDARDEGRQPETKKEASLLAPVQSRAFPSTD